MIQKKKEFAVVSMIMGIIGMVLSCVIVGIVPCIIGLVFGVVALFQKSGKQDFAVVGMITSGIGIVIVVIIVFMALTGQIVFIDEQDQGSIVEQNEEDNSDDSDLDDQVVANENVDNIENVPTDEPIVDPPYHEIACSSNRLIDSYLDDRDACKAKYDEKVLKVTGQIFGEINITENSVYFSLDSSVRDVIAGITCNFSDVDTYGVKELQEGDYVTVIGTGDFGLFTFDLYDCQYVEKTTKEEFDKVISEEPLTICIKYGQENAYSEIDETSMDVKLDEKSYEVVYEYVYRIPAGNYNVRYIGYYNQDKCNFFVLQDTIVNEDGYDTRPINQNIYVTKDEPVTVAIGENELVYTPIGGYFIFEKID